MDQARRLGERSFAALLAQAVEAGREGLVVLRDRDGVRHGIWVQRGYVVGAYVAGRFDPLLSLLAGSGRLDAEGLRRCLAALPHAAATREHTDVVIHALGRDAEACQDLARLRLKAVASKFVEVRACTTPKRSISASVSSARAGSPIVMSRPNTTLPASGCSSFMIAVDRALAGAVGAKEADLLTAEQRW